MSTFKNLFILCLIFAAFSSCTIRSSKDADVEYAEACTTLDGTWMGCAATGGSSTRTTIMISGSSLNETIESFSTNAICAGAPDTTATITGFFEPGVIGGSAYAQNATDIKITPSSQDLGCGAGQPVYDLFRLTNACSRFFASDSGSTCDPNTVSSNITVGPYIRQ